MKRIESGESLETGANYFKLAEFKSHPDKVSYEQLPMTEKEIYEARVNLKLLEEIAPL